VFAITAFGLTTGDPDRLQRFYEGLGFTAGAVERITQEEMALLGLNGGGTRLSLMLGGACVHLDSFDRPGRRYPKAATAADLCFQHFALVTLDASAAWVLALSLGATAISARGPVTLPRSAGGVTAWKFRDPDGHPLELLQFRARTGIPAQSHGLLGIDHSAISVSDAAASKRFYIALGLTAEGSTVNRGGTQQALDGVPKPIVDVLAMRPTEAGPHLELLAYRTPAGRRAEPALANDIVATRTIWDSDRDALIRDPDGHLHLLRKRS
jgi:catechol 2,3-dioxygenase-like lactoylglutathione lyase family enzyme